MRQLARLKENKKIFIFFLLSSFVWRLFVNWKSGGGRLWNLPKCWCSILYDKNFKVLLWYDEGHKYNSIGTEEFFYLF